MLCITPTLEPVVALPRDARRGGGPGAARTGLYPASGGARLEVHNDGVLDNAGQRLLNALENLPGWPARSGKLSPIAPILSSTP